jgi:hypothetical protein
MNKLAQEAQTFILIKQNWVTNCAMNKTAQSLTLILIKQHWVTNCEMNNLAQNN